MLKKLEQINSKKIFSNPYWDYYFDQYIMPNGKTGEYNYVKSRGSTMMIPILDDNRIIMTKQFRYLNQRISIEFPGGGIEKGLNPSVNANKELLEETGYNSKKLIKLGEFNPFNGVTNEICHAYICKGLKLEASKNHHSAKKYEESEEIEIEILSHNEIEKAINSGLIWDGMTMAVWSLYKAHISVI